MRISDNDRRAAADRLGAAAREGRLPVSEYDDRLGRLYQAVTYGDLADLVADLPDPAARQSVPFMPPPAVPAPVVGGFTGPGAVVQNTVVVSNPGVVMLPVSGFATAGLVLGILGLVGFWIPFGDIGLSALAVLFSAIGIAKTGGGAYAGRGRAVAGLVCGLVGMIPAIIVISLLLAAAASVPSV